MPAANGRGWALVGRVLKQRTLLEGYKSVGLSYLSVSKSYLVHTLVALAFVGPKPTPKHIVAHWDNDEGNNFYKNLRWATNKENDLDKDRHGTRPKGLYNGNAKLSDAKVNRIRKLRAKGYTLVVIALRFKIDEGYTSRLCRGERR